MEQHQELVKQNTQLQRDYTALEKKLAARGARIKNLESLMKESEETLQRQFEKHKAEVELAKRGRPQNVRKRSSKEMVAGALRGGGSRKPSGSAATAANPGFWRTTSTSQAGPTSPSRTCECVRENTMPLVAAMAVSPTCVFFSFASLAAPSTPLSPLAPTPAAATAEDESSALAVEFV